MDRSVGKRKIREANTETKAGVQVHSFWTLLSSVARKLGMSLVLRQTDMTLKDPRGQLTGEDSFTILYSLVVTDSLSYDRETTLPFINLISDVSTVAAVREELMALVQRVLDEATKEKKPKKADEDEDE